MKRLFRILALTLALACLCASALPALAIGGTVKQDTRAYQSADASSRSVRVSAGVTVDVVSVSGQWAKVVRNGVTAYMKVGALKRTEAVDFSRAGTMMTVREQCRLYQSPSLEAQSRTVAAGTYAKLLATCDGWAHVTVLGSSCYVQQSMLADLGDTAAYIVADGRVYKEKSTSSASAKVSAGLQVDLIARDGDWALVRRNGVYGYVPSGNVAERSPAPAASVPARILSDGRIYESASLSSRSVKASAGLRVNLVSTENGWAFVEENGVYGYVPVTNLGMESQAAPATAEPAATPAPTATPAPAPQGVEATIDTDGKVYEAADLSSRSVKVRAGLEVNLISKKDGWALIERNGVYGYAPAAIVSEDDWGAAAPDATPSPTATPAPAATSPASVDDVMNNSKYSNEQKCWYFLTKKLNFSTAAACGIMANIRAECDFDPTLGSSYYGLVQWCSSDQKKLRSWCTENGYDSASITGQLSYMYVELKKDYPKVFSYLQNVENSAQGAYDAAYYFCYYYEIPASKARQSEKRGVKARDTYWPKYS